MITLSHCQELDARDPLAHLRARFAQPSEDTIYLDGNSVGAMPADAPQRVQELMTRGWRDARRRGWSYFDWMEKPWLLGEALAPLIGAQPQDVIFTDNTSVNLFKLLAYACKLAPQRPVIVTERYNFPTDVYVAEGLARFLDGKVQLRLIDHPDELPAAMGPDVGVVYLSHVDYRSSYRWPMRQTSALAHAHGALAFWDLSHAAGAIAVELQADGADFAVGCGYKYLCGGPGAPAWLYVRPEHQEKDWPVIAGWMGHQDVFAFAPSYGPLAGVRRHLSGSPAILANQAMSAAADLWKLIEPADLSAKHRSISELLVQLLQERCAALGVQVTSPLDYSQRGGHLTFSHPGAGSVTEALLAHGVVSSFRKPDSIRFGLSPMALSHVDVWTAVDRLVHVLDSGVWREPRFAKVSV
ncbi:MAG: aminotransferase class V-fold PLP-dependent enzyme [Comamonadaceae bacterium]|jgi:kynureninase|nr:aminotransferase class V-fold PLP-dependent enzyme [Comamonadaceae bacterium]